MDSISHDQWKLIQQLALMLYVHQGEEAKELYTTVLTAKLLKGLWDTFSQKSHVDKAREEAILAIAQYVKTHPRASERELQSEIEKQINIFVEKIK